MNVIRFPQIYQVGFLTILIWGSIELVRAKLGPSVLMTREAGKLSLWWLAPILASIRWSLGSPATCAHCSLKILKRLARFSNTILSCQLSSDEQHDATYQLKLFYKFCELWFILWYEELPYCISSHERNALSPLLVWGPCLRGQQGLLPGSGVRGGLGERESGNEQYCCFVSLAMCLAVCFTACKCCTAAVHNCLQYAGPATTRHDHCNVSGRRDHRCLSLPLFFCPGSVLAICQNWTHFALFLFPPNVLFVGKWSLIYRRTDLPGVADERLMGSNSS